MQGRLATDTYGTKTPGLDTRPSGGAPVANLHNQRSLSESLEGYAGLCETQGPQIELFTLSLVLKTRPTFMRDTCRRGAQRIPARQTVGSHGYGIVTILRHGRFMRDGANRQCSRFWRRAHDDADS